MKIICIRKNMPAAFRLGSGAGLAADSKPRGSSVKLGSGGWPSSWAICWWLAGGHLSKAGGSFRVDCGHVFANTVIFLGQMAPGRAPRAPTVTFSACLGQL